DGGLYLINATIPIYPPAGQFNHEPTRRRKLLIKKREFNKLRGAVEREGRTIAATKLYFNDRGMVKIEIALAKGKKSQDKRATIKERDWRRDQARLMREKG
ncbi:MAG: SsrA-binding protein, partial [Hyphomonadaceae bacterium]